jgi:hypothetical protein
MTDTETKLIELQNYELKCGARPIDGGRFVPTIKATKQVWPFRHRIVAVKRDFNPSEEAAIVAAAAPAMRANSPPDS